MRLYLFIPVFGYCCLLLLVSGVPVETMAQEGAIPLKQIVDAARQTDYSGTFIYQSGSYVETSRISHVFDGTNEHERLEGLDGERSEVVRKNGQIWCYLGVGKVMVAKRDGMRTFPALLPEQYELLQENYAIQQGEDERVAGFHARAILFQPKDKLRYAHKMWAQSDSGLLLKAVVLDEHERTIEQYVFTQLQMGGDMDRSWIKSGPADAQASDDAVNSAGTEPAKGSGWVVYSLPAGFKKLTEVTRHLRGSQSPVTHLVFSDGLAGISVFIEKINDKSAVKTGLYSKGVIHVYSKVLDAHLLTVVGEVPARTVMQVAESVRYGGPR